MAIDDKKASGEPSYVGVHICIGSDADGDPILLLDRICLNREAAQQMADDMSMLQQETVVAQGEVRALQELQSETNDRVRRLTLYAFIATCVAWVLPCLLMAFAIRSR